MPLNSATRPPLMCLTQDGPPLSHIEQAVELLVAGAKWIQVRMKRGTRTQRLRTASLIAGLCRQFGAICIINDDLHLARLACADGVHLGKTDGDWKKAREEAGPRFILGGTINTSADARRALRDGCLDYVGIGPWRHTTTKKKLAPILGPDGVRRLVAQLDGTPAWAIGGITPDDLAAVRATGAIGAAVSSVLYRRGAVAANYERLTHAWDRATPTK